MKSYINETFYRKIFVYLVKIIKFNCKKDVNINIIAGNYPKYWAIIQKNKPNITAHVSQNNIYYKCKNNAENVRLKVDI